MLHSLWHVKTLFLPGEILAAHLPPDVDLRPPAQVQVSSRYLRTIAIPGPCVGGCSVGSCLISIYASLPYLRDFLVKTSRRL